MPITSHITDHLFWTEDCRQTSVVVNHYLSYYAYDHRGGSCGSREQSQACLSYAEMEQRRQCQRVLKLTVLQAPVERVEQIERFNANMIKYYSIVGKVTLYTSPYLVANNSGYTKHYYAGSERICARLGNGNLKYHQTQSEPFIGNDAVIENNTQALFGSVMVSMSDRGLTDNSRLTIRALCNNSSDQLSVHLNPVLMNVSVATTVTTAGFSDIMEYFAIQTQQNESPNFYHSDQLGSASWITDASGIPVQHLQLYYHARFSSTRSTGACTTFGEPFVNQHTSGYQERFTFTGKERDAETGFSYFGARYYDSDLSGLFLSVDPMTDKYPNISPYAYCAWNPVKLIDPDGNEMKDPPASRVTVQNGYVILNMDNLHKSTRAKISQFNNNPRNWPKGQIGSLKPLAQVWPTTEIISPQGGYGYSEPSKAAIKTEAVVAKSTGLPDKRVKPRPIMSNGTRLGNVALIAVEATLFSINAITGILWNRDKRLINEHLALMNEAFNDVMLYALSEVLPDKYNNPRDILNIANYVLQKENKTDDKNINIIGDKIRKKLNYKYDKEIKQCED